MSSVNSNLYTKFPVALESPSKGLQELLLGALESQQGISAPTCLLLSHDMESGISKADALQRNFLSQRNYREHDLYLLLSLLLNYPIASPSRAARWLFSLFVQNKLFRDVIQYGLPAFESRMSAGGNEGVGCFPSNYKRSSVITSRPVDFWYSRNNPDAVRPLCRRTSGVHIFLFLPYSLARQMLPLPGLTPEDFSRVTSKHLGSGASRRPTDDFVYIICFLTFFFWSHFSTYTMWPHFKELLAHNSLFLTKCYFWRH